MMFGIRNSITNRMLTLDILDTCRHEYGNQIVEVEFDLYDDAYAASAIFVTENREIAETLLKTGRAKFLDRVLTIRQNPAYEIVELGVIGA